jgi:hypothetical protein
VGLGKTTTKSIQRTKDTNVQQPSPNPARLQEKILPPNRCFGIWCGHRTLTKGRKTIPLLGKTNQTHNPPSSILLSNIHPNRAKLQHLQMRTPGNHEVISTLATLLRMDKRTIYNPNRSCQPLILEISQRLE